MMDSVESRSDAGIVILGAGVAGLMAAIETGAAVYEAEAVCGGAAASDTVAGFTFDRGLHVLQTANPAVVTMLEKLGIEFEIIDRSAYIYRFGKYTAYPFQINSTHLRLDRRLRCVLSFLRRNSNQEPTNYAEWIYRAIGRGFGDTFLIPYSEKFWGVHPRDMSFEWTGKRVPAADVWQVLRGAVVSDPARLGARATFRYPKGPGGYGTVAARMYQKVRTQVHLGHRATRIDTVKRQVTFGNGVVADYKVLLSTIPLPVLAKIVDHVPLDVQCAIADLTTNSIMVVNIGVHRAAITDKHWVHFPEKDISFFRVSFPHNFGRQLAPPGMSSVSAEVSYPTGAPPDRARLTDRVIADLVRVGILRSDDRVVVRHTLDMPYGYCIFNDKRRAALPVIRKWLNSVDIVPGGRYGLWTYFGTDEAMLSARKAAELAMRHLQQARAGALISLPEYEEGV